MAALRDLDYRQIIKSRIAEFKKGKSLKLKELAQKIGVQYTFLSRSLGAHKVQLNEDHLYALCRLLHFNQQEIDYILLLRQKENSIHPDRVKHLEQKILQCQKLQKMSPDAQLHSSYQSSAAETRYLLNPMSMLVHAALNIPRYFRDTKLLSFDLKISLQELEAILADLEILGMISLQANSRNKVASLEKSQLHVGPDHPLMRTNQQLLKMMAIQRLQKVADSKKISYMATFTVDEKSLPKIRKAQEKFMEELKEIAIAADANLLYQFSLDIFPWVDE